jgi:hypothetical protein
MLMATAIIALDQGLSFCCLLTAEEGVIAVSDTLSFLVSIQAAGQPVE